MIWHFASELAFRRMPFRGMKIAGKGRALGRIRGRLGGLPREAQLHQSLAKRLARFRKNLVASMAQTLLGRAHQRFEVIGGFLAEFADRLLQGQMGDLFEAHLVGLNGLIAQLRDGLSQSAFLALRFHANRLEHGSYLRQQILAGLVQRGLRIVGKKRREAAR